MSDKIEDGGQAFPIAFHSEGNNADTYGMSLRDYFAAAALQGQALLMAAGMAEIDIETPPAKLIARFSYEIADAMLKARQP